MEQIQIRQPKMPAAQSFIQILGTFLAKLLIFCSHAFSFIKNSLFILKTGKSIGATGFSFKKSNYICNGEKCQRGGDLRI